MVVTFTKGSTKSSGGSGGLFDYLDKENQERIDEYLQTSYDNVDIIGQSNTDKIVLENNLYFNQNDEKFEKEEASKVIDENLSSNAKKDQSQFFMVNISPSKSELEHLERIAELELKRNGIGEKEAAILNSTEQGRQSLDAMKNDLMHQQMREYTKDVMKDYAENFNRDVYANPELLPTKKQEREISIVAKEKLKDLGITENDGDYNSLLIKTKQDLAKSIGKDLSTRKMDENDLVWFGKIEERRTYKPTDKWVMQNKKINKKIDQLRTNGDKDNKIPELEKQLNLDKTTGKVVQEGMAKGGSNYHAHVVVSRYDRCPDKDKKISLSPMANQRTGDRLDGKKDVGFDRDNFRNKVEKSFDTKFKFQRLNTYEDYKRRKNSLYKSNNSTKVINKVRGQIGNKVSNIIKAPLKPIRNEIRNMSGKNELNKLNMQSTISKELGFRIPLKIPATPLQGAVQMVRSIVGKIMESSRGY